VAEEGGRPPFEAHTRRPVKTILRTLVYVRARMCDCDL
jgi:hypothetical protein